jgi:DNA-binding transcriptional regulator YiaG
MAKEKKTKILDSRKTKAVNPYFEGIRGGLLEAVDSLEKGKPLTCREVTLPEPPPEMNAREIIHLRKNELHLSQHVFAVLLNVSLKTVQAWEQALNSPGGPSLRLLWLAKQRPDLFKSLLTRHAG